MNEWLNGLPSHPHITANPKPPTLTFPKMQHAQASASPEPMQLPSLSLCRPHNPDFKHMPTHTRSFDNLTDPTCPETKLFQINPPPTCRTASPIQATPTRDPGPCANHTPTTPANHTASTPSQCHDSKAPKQTTELYLPDCRARKAYCCTTSMSTDNRSPTDNFPS